MKKFFSLSAIAVLLPSLFMLFMIIKAPSAFALSYNPAYLISDKLFSDAGSMSVNDIQTFLDNENSGIKNLTDTEACSPTTPTSPDPWASSYYPHCGAVENAATLIYDAAQAYDISPRTIMATMEKEESLITDPTPWQSNSGAVDCAMGYTSFGLCGAGFFTQVDNGAWQLRLDVQLMTGQSFWGYTPSQYICSSAKSIGPSGVYNSSGQQVSMEVYSAGLYPGATVTFDNPAVYNSSGGLVGGKNPTVPQTITLANSSTAALYCYTPYVGPYSYTGYSGSYNFVTWFETWWGSVSSPCYNDTNISGAISGESVLPDKLGINHTDNFTLIQPNNTGTACLENYTWQNGTFGSWQSLTASITPAVNTANSGVISADLNGDGVDELYLVDYNGTGSGRLEVHGWTSNMQGWVSHIATNSPTWSRADAEVIACDPSGSGHDNLFLVEYRGTTSGDVEIHEWSTDLQSWVNHWDTHYTAINPQTAQIVCGDLNGDGKDEFYLVQYNSTGSGQLEIHGGITNLGYYSAWPYSSPAQWPVHTATVSGPRVHWESAWPQGSTSGAPADDADLIMADTVGNGVDRPYIIQYHGTASGRIEVYQMSNDFKRWVMLTTTNQGQY